MGEVLRSVRTCGMKEGWMLEEEEEKPFRDGGGEYRQLPSPSPSYSRTVL